MTPELVIVMLEQHVRDIRSGLVGPAWSDFVSGLELHSATLEATRRSLEEWTDRVVDLMGRFDYTKGILKGIAIAIDPGTRGIPRWQPANTAPAEHAAGARATTEAELVARVENVVRLARSVS